MVRINAVVPVLPPPLRFRVRMSLPRIQFEALLLVIYFVLISYLCKWDREETG